MYAVFRSRDRTLADLEMLKCTQGQHVVFAYSILQSLMDLFFLLSSNVWVSLAWWILEDMSDLQEEVTVVMCNNISCIAIAKNLMFHARRKHIKVHWGPIPFHLGAALGWDLEHLIRWMGIGTQSCHWEGVLEFHWTSMSPKWGYGVKPPLDMLAWCG